MNTITPNLIESASTIGGITQSTKNSLLECNEFTLDGDEVSLDAFQQERTTLDAVFAELSDPEIPSEKPTEVQLNTVRFRTQWLVTTRL